MILITGTSIKTDGSIRQWNNVEYVNKRYSRKSFATMYIVHENGEERQINMDTFTGDVLSEDSITHYEQGQQTGKEWYHSPYIGETCLSCHVVLTEENALCSVQMCNKHRCQKCGDLITDDNKSYSTMVCNKPECERYASLMDW